MPAPDRPPSFPLYVRDFLGDKHVRRMEQMPWPHGFVAAWGYTRIWMSSWEEPEPGVLPDDDLILATMAGISIARWPRYREIIQPCFDTTSRPGFWVQKRVVRERQLMAKRKEMAEKFGRTGGRKSAQVRKKGRDPQDPLKPPSTVHGIPPPGYPPASASAVASAFASEDSEPSRAKTELSAAPGSAVPAGTAGSRARVERPDGAETEPPRGGPMASVGSVLGSVLAGLGAAPPGPEPGNRAASRGTLTGADLSTDEGVAKERDAQRRQLERGDA